MSMSKRVHKKFKIEIVRIFLKGKQTTVEVFIAGLIIKSLFDANEAAT